MNEAVKLQRQQRLLVFLARAHVEAIAKVVCEYVCVSSPSSWGERGTFEKEARLCIVPTRRGERRVL